MNGKKISHNALGSRSRCPRSEWLRMSPKVNINNCFLLISYGPLLKYQDYCAGFVFFRFIGLSDVLGIVLDTKVTKTGVHA